MKRGYWVVRRVLGETIPPPPPVVPELPSDEAKSDLPLRDMLAQHRANPVCAACHARFDSFGLAFEGYGPVGESAHQGPGGTAWSMPTRCFPAAARATGFAGRARPTSASIARTITWTISAGKLLAYALSRSLLLSDDPDRFEQMQANLAANGYRFASLVETIVTSPQFLNRRSSDLRPDKPDSQSRER